MTFSVLLIGLALLYAAFIGTFAVGLRRVLSGSDALHFNSPVKSIASELPRVSVLIAARNEVRTLGRTLDSILAGTYPAPRLELIVVDDASSDGTSEVVRLRQRVLAPAVPAGMNEEEDEQRQPVLKLLRLESPSEGRGNGKRAALEAALAHASGEIILLTDADCRVGPGWIGSMVEAFRPGVGFVAGPVLFRYAAGLGQRIQALEFMGLVAMGAGGIGLGRPVICNGANAGFRASAFRGAGGFGADNPGAPGQEELLMHRIAATGTRRVAFCADPLSAVLTEPARNLSAFLDQRIRWAAQAPRLPGAAFTALLVAVFAFLLLLPPATIGALFVPELRPAVVAAWLLKGAFDLTVLYPACRYFGRTGLLRVFIPAQFLHPVYIAYCAAAGVLGRYTWKERTVPA